MQWIICNRNKLYMKKYLKIAIIAAFAKVFFPWAQKL